MNLNEAVFDPVLTPSVFDGGLDAEHQVHLWAAQVKKAPVHALVDRGVLGNRGLRVCQGDDLELIQLNLEATELHALVVLEAALDPDKRTGGQSRNRGC